MYPNNTTFTNVLDYPLPSSIDAEESVLGGLLFDREAYSRVKDILVPEAFLLKDHQEIYKAICHVAEEKQVTDLITVTNYLVERKKLDKIGGASKLAHFIDRCVSAANIDNLARLLIDKMLHREAIGLGAEIQKVGYTFAAPVRDFLQKIEALTHRVTQSRHRYSSSDEYAIEQCNKLVAEVQRIELEVDRPDHREFLLQELANKHNRRDVNALKNLYYKSLIAQENEPSMPLEEAIAKYGYDVNKWLQQGMLPVGKTVLLHGAAGDNKTTTAYNFVFHLATGTHWGNYSVTKDSRRCLIVQTDEAPSDMLRKLANRGIEGGMPIRVKTKWTVDHMQHLRKEIIEHGSEFVVIDSLTSVSKNSLISENDAEYARPILMLRDIAAETGATILILHHDSKEKQSRGSSAIVASVSEVLHIMRDPQDNDLNSTVRLLIHEKSRSRCLGATKIEINTEDFSVTCHGRVDQ
ncbi:MAG: DnaB-like helicase N-terminal domain-containing protein [Cyanophyceae cyanobacterium]